MATVKGFGSPMLRDKIRRQFLEGSWGRRIWKICMRCGKKRVYVWLAWGASRKDVGLMCAECAK